MSVTLWIPALNDGHEGVNFSNGNFCRIMDLVGVPGSDNAADGLCGTWPVEQLPSILDKLEFALASLDAMPALDGGSPDQHYRGTMGCQVIECGLPDGYYRRRLNEIRDLVATGIVKGKEVVWG